MTKILIASNNPGKLVEIQALLTPETGLQEVVLLLPRHLGLTLEVVEDGQTYAENAILKARAFHQAALLPANRVRPAEPLIILADDSGLEVDALGGAPGLHSARYSAKPGATDADRRAFLLHNLMGASVELPPGRAAQVGWPRPWLAHFHCTVALIAPDGELICTEGDCPGEIIPEERGSNGFGYDPIFLLPALGRTMAELTLAEKNQLSHRALAVKAAIPFLQRWLTPPVSPRG